MKWSVSTSRIFYQCARKWYYETVFADSRSKHPERQEAYVLKRLQSVHSWRGKVVDHVISRFIVPRLNKHESFESDEVFSYANRLMEAQLKFAIEGRYRNGAKSDNEDFCALFELEYNGSIEDKAIENAKKEVEISLTNLLASSLMRELAEEGQYLIAQRTLQFQFSEVNVKCTPDLIVFFKSKSPVIIDWKVQVPWHRDHWLQLGVYGLALSRVMPHKDFPHKWYDVLTDPSKIRLIEFQLLRNQQIQYILSQEDVINIEDYIYTSSNRMLQVINGREKPPELVVELLPTARSPDICLKCKFKKICWKGNFS